MTDQNGNVHTFLYDLLGRQTSDCVTTLGDGVDNAVLRISATYEVRWLPVNITSYNNPTFGLGSVVNDIQRSYNNFAQLIAEYQSHSGAVNTGTTPQCQYQYLNGSGNTIRPTALIYPNGRVLNYSYGVSGAMSDSLSRIQSLIDNDGITHLCNYTYLGLSSIVQTYSEQPGLSSTLISLTGSNDPVTGDIYSGLDLFARVKDLIWTSASGSSSSSSSSSSGAANILERIQHGYDRASNRLWRAELADLARQHDEIYIYDGLHRLKKLDRGTLNDGITGVTNEQFAQCWTLDATGNWKKFRQDNDGNGVWDLVQQRTANQVNEITGITSAASGGGLPMALPAPLGVVCPQQNSWVEPKYDAAGNMVTMPQPGSPTQGFNATYDAWNRMVGLSSSAGSVGQYQYDGVRRRIVKQTFSPSTTRDFYYSAGWRDLEERVGGSNNPQRQFVWGRKYIDDLVLRDRDTTGAGTLNERLFSIHDPNTNVTAVMSAVAEVVERYEYDADGMQSVLSPAFAKQAATNYTWEIGYASYRLDVESGLYCVRHRMLSSLLGCWGRRDPLGLGAGVNLYIYVGNNPTRATDPHGLIDIYPPEGKFWFDTVKVKIHTPDKNSAVLKRVDPTNGERWSCPAITQWMFYVLQSLETRVAEIFAFGADADPGHRARIPMEVLLFNRLSAEWRRRCRHECKDGKYPGSGNTEYTINDLVATETVRGYVKSLKILDKNRREVELDIVNAPQKIQVESFNGASWGDIIGNAIVMGAIVFIVVTAPTPVGVGAAVLLAAFAGNPSQSSASVNTGRGGRRGTRSKFNPYASGATMSTLGPGPHTDEELKRIQSLDIDKLRQQYYEKYLKE